MSRYQNLCQLVAVADRLARERDDARRATIDRIARGLLDYIGCGPDDLSYMPEAPLNGRCSVQRGVSSWVLRPLKDGEVAFTLNFNCPLPGGVDQLVPGSVNVSVPVTLIESASGEHIVRLGGHGTIESNMLLASPDDFEQVNAAIYARIEEGLRDAALRGATG